MLSHSLSVMFSGILEILQVAVQFKRWWYGSHVDLRVRWCFIGGLDPLEMCSVVRANSLKGNNTFAVNELQAKITVRGNRMLKDEKKPKQILLQKLQTISLGSQNCPKVKRQ